MATATATAGLKRAFLGGADNCVCYFTPVAEGYVQVEVQGFTLDNSTVEVLGTSSGAAWDEIPVADARHVAIIGAPGARMAAIRISGVTAGSYQVTFTPS